MVGRPRGRRGRSLPARDRPRRRPRSARRAEARLRRPRGCVARHQRRRRARPRGGRPSPSNAHSSAPCRRAQAHLAEVDAALARLDDESYGRCDHCGRPVGAARLAARPTARRCIDCARDTRGNAG
ncbi:TraR/DksA family transcriptional regulator [Nocardioides sp.]|uniref:TraR/DksA family transcriptional regulator n=1 Tax=Nocardioides sp. TaxID=35761 RepID=UPI0035273202